MKYTNVKPPTPTLDIWESYDEFVGEDHVFTFTLNHIPEIVRFSVLRGC